MWLKLILQPPSPTLQRRPASQAIERPQPTRRPSSSLFQNPFQRNQSRVSLAFGDVESPPIGDDGSFVVRNFRHVSGVSGTNTESDYLSQGGKRSTATTTVQEQPRKDSFPTSPQRARPPSAAGSVEQRVSVAAFRRNIRRPSSTVLVDDEDDLPLSMSRANLRESTLRRDSSAVSLTEDVSHLKVADLVPGSPVSRSGAASPASATRSPLPSARPSLDNQNNENRRSLVIKAVQTTRQSSDHPRRTPVKDDMSPVPTGRTRMSSPPLSSPPVSGGGIVPRPNRKSSLTILPLSNPRTPPQFSSPPKTTAPLADAPQVPPIVNPYQSPTKISHLPKLDTTSTEVLEDIKLPPRPHEIPDEVPRSSRPPSRGGTLSPSMSGMLDEPLRRISGFWGGTPQDDDREEAFDPAVVSANGLGLTEGDRSSSFTNNLNRQSLYDRLSAATTGVTNAVGSVAAIVSPSLDDSGERLYIPPVGSPTRETTLAQSPGSDRTASPVPVPPPMKTAPAPPPGVSHSSFGRVPKVANVAKSGKSNKAGWEDSSSSEDEQDKTPPARRVLETSAPVRAPPPAAPGGPRQRVVSVTQPIKSVVLVESDSEEETLRTIRAKASSRSELRPPMSRSSTSSLKSALKVPKRPSPAARPQSTFTTSASNWSLSSSSPSPEQSPDSNSGPSGPPTRPTSRLSRPSSHANMRRVGSGDRLSQLNPTERQPMGRAASSDRLRQLGRTTSAEHVGNGSARVQSILREPSPRHSVHVAPGKVRHTASPASTQSGLTGDSAPPQPMTPRSAAESRRSWVDGRPRVHSEATERARPSTVMDQWPGAAQQPAYPYGPGMEMYAAAAQAQAYGPPNPAQFEAMKHQMQAQWMTAASRYFEDCWERASNVSNAQTAPNGPSAFPQPTYGYSYQPTMPPPPPMFPQGYGQFPGGFPYPYPGSPQVAFPGMGMPMQQPVAMGSMGMPMSSGGGMFSYGGAAQSVYGGEFGPPVAPGMQPEPQSHGSPRRTADPARRLFAEGRPSSIASHSAAPRQRAVVPPSSTPPRRQLPVSSRRSAGRPNSPPSSWHAPAFEDETPRPKRVTNAS